MKWTQIPLGPIQTNAYVLENEQKEAIIFDPGSEGQSLVKWLQKEQIKPLAILLTHAHFDHIGAVDDVRDAFSCPVYVHEKEQDWLGNPELNRSTNFMGEEHALIVKKADHIIREEGLLEVGSFTFSIYETPGHSPGSVSYYSEENNIVFSGDALFSRSIGRTDLPGGDHKQLLQSIHTKLLELPEGTIVACGHGPTTTIAEEMDANPFLSGF